MSRAHHSMFQRLQPLFAGFVCCLSLAACAPSDPLESIRLRQAAGQFATTLEPLRALVDDGRTDPETLYLYGRALSMTGQVSLAEWSLHEAMKDPQWLVPAGLQLANGALRTQVFPLAIEAAEKILALHPDNVAARLVLANAYVYSNLNEEGALEEVERILEIDPDNLAALEPRVLALLRLDRADEAAEVLKELGRRIDESEMGEGMTGWHCATTAIFAYESGDLDLAEERWARCVERYPDHPNVIRNAMKYYDDRGELDRSMEICRRALADAPDTRQYRQVLAARLRIAGRLGEAEAVLREGTETDHPGLASLAWIDLAKHLQGVGRQTAAAQAVDRAVESMRILQEPPPGLLLEQADAWLLAGNLERAKEIAEGMGLAAYREMILARVAQEHGDYPESLAHFDEAFRLWPSNPWARYHAARAAEAIGDFDRALEEYRHSVRISPGATDARVRAARLISAQGQPAGALNLLRIKADEDPLDLAGELLSVRLWAEIGKSAQMARGLELFQRGNPENLARAVALAAEGVEKRSGPAAAVAIIREWGSKGLIDLGDPSQAEVLSAFVRHASRADRGAEAAEAVGQALAAHPEASALHAVHGFSLELGGSDEAARVAYRRAIELNPSNAPALAGLGRLLRAADPAEALALFERAHAIDPQHGEYLFGAARALIAQGEVREAEERLEALLAEHPEDGEAAATLVRLHLDRGLASDRTLDLANRAARFGGGADALDLLSRVHRERDEAEEANQAASRARVLRGGTES